MNGSPASADLLPLLTAREMQLWDGRTISGRKVPGPVLMESAGRAAARVLSELFPDGPVVAMVGRGNNGGDAVVLLRTLRAWGREVVAVPVRGGDLPADLLHGWQLPVVAPEDAAVALRTAGVIVDGVLGTGASGAPREPEAAAVVAMNSAGRPIVALDGPTGVDLDSGATPGPAVRAAATVTFGAPKRGLVLFPGREHAGRVVVVEIGLEPLSAEEVSAGLITPAWAVAHLHRRPLNAHKGGAGTLAVVAGHPGMGGAAILVAMGALRSGAGKVRTVTHDANRIALQTVVPEGLFVDRDGDGVEGVVESADALVVGPGMGTDERSRDLLRTVLARARGPMVVDADAVTLISREPALLDGDVRERVVLTPHPGEMARLMEVETGDVVADPFGMAGEAARRFGCVVLLKGTPSVIAASGRPTLVNVAGHSGIATSGMGDTLAGVIGAQLGMGTPPREAAAVGVLVAGIAADRAGRGRALLPRDVAEALPGAIADLGRFGTLTLPEARLDLPAAR